MADCQTQSEELNTNSAMNTSSNQVPGPLIVPQPQPPAPQINSSNVGFKRKGSNIQNDDTPHKQPWVRQQDAQMKKELFCEICLVQLNSVSQVVQHKQGRVHLSKAKKVEEFRTMLQNSPGHGITSNAPIHPQLLALNPPPLPTEEPKQLGGISLKCDICEKVFNSESQAVQHFRGQKHKFQLQTVGGSNPEFHANPLSNTSQQRIDASHSATPASNASQQRTDASHSVTAPENKTLPLWLTNSSENKGLFCAPCRLRVNSQIQMDTHLQGAKHKNIVASLQTQRGSQPLLRCEDCMTTFNSDIQLTQHLTSPKHLNKVQKKQTSGAQIIEGQTRGRGRGQGRGRGVTRGGQSHRGRGTFKPPPITSNFVKAADQQQTFPGFPCFPPVGGAPFQQPFV